MAKISYLRVWMVVISAALLSAGLLMLASPAEASFPGPNGKIAFQSYRDGFQPEIYVMNADGSDPTNITNNSVGDYTPTFSPDGTQIAFMSTRDGDSDIYLMNADGSDPTNITNNSVGDFSPTWSPDGTQIAFSTDRDGNYEIYVMNADGSDPTNITEHQASDQQPEWSPDGQKIAFQSFRAGSVPNIFLDPEIFTMNPDGSGLTELTDNTTYDQDATWSPDNQKIAYTSFKDFNSFGLISVMNAADGSEKINLTDSSVSGDGFPSWSPDNTKIAFVRGGNIQVMNAQDGTGMIELTSNSSDVLPDWGTSKAPQNKEQCKNGGWQDFPSLGFKDQGDCVSYVETHGKNEPNKK